MRYVSFRLGVAGFAVAVLSAATLYANHSWGNYHWARTSNPFTLQTGDNVGSQWDAYLDEAILDWNQAAELPRGWHSATICGGHNYRTCARCKTVYALTSMNAVGPAPSVHCEVCGQVIIEWGSSKIWDAVLIQRSSS
jgi:hypothetical protein